MRTLRQLFIFLLQFGFTLIVTGGDMGFALIMVFIINGVIATVLLFILALIKDTLDK